MSNQNLTDLLSRLIATPSVNPAHNPDPEICGEKRMAALFAELFADLGLEVEWRFPMGQDRPAVIGRSNPSQIKSTLMFEMHLDTVGVAGMTVPPFKAEIREEKLYGRGACDMKGAMAALFHALNPERIASLSARGIQLLLVGAPDEETGLGGSTLMAAEGLGADDAIVLEPTGCRPVIAHKGAYWYDITLQGRAGHGSQPEKGVSTHAALAELLPFLYRTHAQTAAAYPHDLLGNSTLNIGRIEGGHTYNIIPDQTKLLLDRRIVPNEPPALFAEAVQQKLDEMVKAGTLLGGKIELTSQTQAFATSPGSPLVNQLQAAIQKVTGKTTEPYGTSWVSDASPFSQTCKDILVFGPGDIAQAHTEDEHITLEQLQRGSNIFAELLDSWE